MQKLIAIDGNSLMHRAYYALPAMTTADGTPTGALHGFLGMLLKLVSTNPDYLVVAFDMHGPTFRHATYAEYKAGRRPTPDDLRAQFPLLKELLIEMGISVCECERYEADDILGTFSRMCGARGIASMLVTGDRDALQLVDAGTHVLLTKKGVTDTVEYDTDTLMQAYGLTPDHMRDLKGLMGDGSDNIPGVPGVGEKTALKLLGEYDTLENVLAHADEVKGKLGERLREHADSARMSYEIGTICTSAPITLTLEDCAFHPERMQRARKRLFALELRGIASRLPGESDTDGGEADAPEATPPIPLDSLDALAAVVGKAGAHPTLALDAGETITFALSEGTSYVIAQGDDLFSQGIELSDALRVFAPILADPEGALIVFDVKKLKHMLDAAGVPLACTVFDAMIADYLLNANRPAGTLAALLEQRYHTAGLNVAALFPLAREMRARIDAAGMRTLYDEMELPLAYVLFDMEKRGFKVDAAILQEMSTTFSERIQTLAKEIYALAGEEFNILSTKQLGEILYDKLGLPAKKKTKSGYSTDADSLEAIAEQNAVVPLVLEYRFITKMKSTFIDGLIGARSTDGRVRSSFNQCVTATGRISSTEPNLQNIPVRTELGREIRRAFIPSEGRVLVGADYSQIELRLLAHISGDAGMIEAFRSGEDIHRRTASEVFGASLDEVTQEQRSAAKAVNFGIVYGISDFGLAKNLGIPVKRAAEYIRLYFERYPRVKAYLTESVEEARTSGFAKTLFGRRRAVPELSSGNYNTRSFGERVAMNMPIQGTAADIIKLAMVRAPQRLREHGLSAPLILQVHDELIFDTPREEAEEVSALVRDCMEHVIELAVPLLAEVKIGNSWYETK